MLQYCKISFVVVAILCLSFVFSNRVYGQGDDRIVKVELVYKDNNNTPHTYVVTGEDPDATINLKQIVQELGTSTVLFSVTLVQANAERSTHLLTVNYTGGVAPTMTRLNACQQQHGICSDDNYGDSIPGATKVDRNTYRWYLAGDSGCTEGNNNHCYISNEDETIRGAGLTESTATPIPATPTSDVCPGGRKNGERCEYECAPGVKWYCTQGKFGASAECFDAASRGNRITQCPVSTPTPNFNGTYTCRVSGVNGFCGAKTGAEAQKFQTYCQGTWDYRSDEMKQCTADQFCYTECTHDPRR